MPPCSFPSMACMASSVSGSMRPFTQSANFRATSRAFALPQWTYMSWSPAKILWRVYQGAQTCFPSTTRSMLSQVEKGDVVITTGGLHGKVTGLADDVLTVEIAPNVRVKLSRAAIATRTPGKSEGDKS